MSEDDFWKKWAGGSGPGNEKPEPEPVPNHTSEPEPSTGGVDADVLAQWLQALPPTDHIVPPATPIAPTPAANPAELAELWPPAAPVDPFTGISKAASNATDADWDLAFDLEPTSTTPAVPPAPAAPPASSAPEAAPSLSGFALDLGNLSGPAPAANPFAPPDSAVPAPPPVPSEVTPVHPLAPVPPAPVPAPFGPPPPPVAPPQEALQAPPLRLEITSGRRTVEQNIQGEALIGRPDATRGVHPEIDLRLDDAVSRRHAKIFVRNGRYVLTDLNSTNGTRYNREWLQPEVEVPLKAGDEIEVGEVTLIRVLEAPESHA